jgi:steroid delta-isomerase-like uncharacterized protein
VSPTTKDLSAKQTATVYAYAVWNEKNVDAIDQYVANDVLIHSPLGDFRGIQALKEVVQVWLTGFPDLAVTNELVITENDLVSIQWHAKGTHKGEFKGRLPAEKPISYSGVTVYRVVNGKIVEYWAYLDMQHLLNQID